MPYTNFPFYIRNNDFYIPHEHIDYSVLLFTVDNSSFITIAKTADVNRLTQLAASLSNQTGFAWNGAILTASQHNQALELAHQLAVRDSLM